MLFNLFKRVYSKMVPYLSPFICLAYYRNYLTISRNIHRGKDPIGWAKCYLSLLALVYQCVHNLYLLVCTPQSAHQTVLHYNFPIISLNSPLYSVFWCSFGVISIANYTKFYLAINVPINALLGEVLLHQNETVFLRRTFRCESTCRYAIKRVIWLYNTLQCFLIIACKF